MVFSAKTYSMVTPNSMAGTLLILSLTGASCESVGAALAAVELREGRIIRARVHSDNACMSRSAVRNAQSSALPAALDSIVCSCRMATALGCESVFLLAQE